MIKYFHFYSSWSIIIHILYYLNIIDNTFPVALFVLFVSQLFLFVYPGYIYKDMTINWVNEFVLHWLPVILIEHSFENIHYLYISLLVYLFVFNKTIVVIYNDPIRYLSEL